MNGQQAAVVPDDSPVAAKEDANLATTTDAEFAQVSTANTDAVKAELHTVVVPDDPSAVAAATTPAVDNDEQLLDLDMNAEEYAKSYKRSIKTSAAYEEAMVFNDDFLPEVGVAKAQKTILKRLLREKKDMKERLNAAVNTANSLKNTINKQSSLISSKQSEIETLTTELCNCKEELVRLQGLEEGGDGVGKVTERLKTLRDVSPMGDRDFVDGGVSEGDGDGDDGVGEGDVHDMRRKRKRRIEAARPSNYTKAFDGTEPVDGRKRVKKTTRMTIQQRARRVQRNSTFYESHSKSKRHN